MSFKTLKEIAIVLTIIIGIYPTVFEISIASFLWCLGFFCLAYYLFDEWFDEK